MTAAATDIAAELDALVGSRVCIEHGYCAIKGTLRRARREAGGFYFVCVGNLALAKDAGDWDAWASFRLENVRRVEGSAITLRL